MRIGLPTKGGGGSESLRFHFISTTQHRLINASLKRAMRANSFVAFAILLALTTTHHVEARPERNDQEVRFIPFGTAESTAAVEEGSLIVFPLRCQEGFRPVGGRCRKIYQVHHILFLFLPSTSSIFTFTPPLASTRATLRMNLL